MFLSTIMNNTRIALGSMRVPEAATIVIRSRVTLQLGLWHEGGGTARPPSGPIYSGLVSLLQLDLLCLPSKSCDSSPVALF